MDLLCFSSEQFSEYQKPESFGNLTARLLYIILKMIKRRQAVPWAGENRKIGMSLICGLGVVIC
jgi:hypothetical protein